MQFLRQLRRKVLQFAKRYKREIDLASILILSAFASWSWQKSTETDLDCRFDALAHRLDQLEISMQADQLHSRKLLMTAVRSQDNQSFVDAIRKSDETLQRSQDHALKNMPAIQKEIDATCSKMNSIGWSFFAMLLMSSLMLSMFSFSIGALAGKDARTKRVNRD